MYQRSRLISKSSAPDKPAIQENGDPRKSPHWHSRGYLPHFEGGDILQMVTFHLSDSLPHRALVRMQSELNALPREKRDITRRKRLDALTDAGIGSCLLGKPENAELIEISLLTFDSRRYRLFAWVIMPNHIHVLLQPLNDWTVAKIVSSWKGFTARRLSVEARASRWKRAYPIWHREYWDRFIRDDRHSAKAIDYIHSNPTKAGLVAKAESWPWGSARFSLGSPFS